MHVQAARTLLTLDDKETKRLFEGEALLRRMYKYGLLEESQNKLDYVLALTPQARARPPTPAAWAGPSPPCDVLA
jgi:hypothetical protein